MEADRLVMRPLDGVRVLELGRRLGVSSAGLSLVALGADVVQVRHPDRQVPTPESVYYDRGRVVVDLGPDIDTVAAGAQIIVTDLTEQELDSLDVPADQLTLRGLEEPAVLVTIRSFGATGPNRDLRMTDLTEWASGGLAPVTRRPYPADPDAYVPVLPPGCQPQALAGLAAATAAIAGRRMVRVSGEPVVADVSVQEVVAAMLHGIYPHFVWLGVVTGHSSTPASALGMLLPASDGDVYIRTVDPRQWEALVEWVGDESLNAMGADPHDRLANHDALELLLAKWSATQGRDELFEEGQRRRVPIALPRSLDDVLTWQHLRARGVWRETQLDGLATEIPRLPLLEPPGWPPIEETEAAVVAKRWSER